MTTSTSLLPDFAEDDASKWLPSGRYGLRQIVRSEFTKMRTLRSTWWSFLVMTVGMIGVTVLTVEGDTHKNASWYQGFDPTNQAMSGLALGALVIGVLGALAVTGEYGSGTVRSSLMATPDRRKFVLGKVIVLGVVALVVSEVLTFACFFVGQLILSHGGAPSASLGQSGVFTAVALSGAFLALLGLMALGLGLIVRHTAGAIAFYVAVTILVPILIGRLPGQPARFSPIGILANSVSVVDRQPGQLSAPLGFVLMLLYGAVALLVGQFLLSRKDA
jgi:ABC-2 type transport system permease protein